MSIERPLAVAWDKDDRILVGHDQMVSVYTCAGVELFKLGCGSGEFSKPNDIARGASGSIYVTDCLAHHVKVYDETGRFKFRFGEGQEESTRLRYPTGIAIDEKRGEVYIADQGNARISVFSLDGNYLRSFGQLPIEQDGRWNFEGAFSRLQGLAVDASGRVFAVDSYQNNAQILDRAGMFLECLSTDSTGRHYFSLPTDIAIQGNHLFITSTNRSDIVVFTLQNLPPPDDDPGEAPGEFELYQNYPNPFNSSTTIPFFLKRDGAVDVSIWNAAGALIANVANEDLRAGRRVIVWNGVAGDGSEVASGSYFVKLRVVEADGAEINRTGRITLIH
jgi:sugar lactone lactonase YvrE